MHFDRRTILRGAGIGSLVFLMGGREVVLTAKEARAAGVPFRTLTSQQVSTIEALGDTLLPGAAEAGIAHFIDQQISAPPREALLTLRYLDVAPPFASFYRDGIAALDIASKIHYGKAFGQLDRDAREQIVRRMINGAPAGWHGPPAPFFYFALRSDAVDVVYGTIEGFRKLNVPYMPHIVPPRPW
jgi:hypothetical protein